MKRIALALLFSSLAAGIAQAQPGRDTLNTAGWAVEVTGLDSLRPCAGESVRVVVRGWLPNPCWIVRRIEIAPLLCFAPCAPRVEMLFDDRGCLRLPCAVDSVPFEREIHYGGLPAGSFLQEVDVFTVTCADTFPPERPRAQLAQPFAVLPESLCGTQPEGCLIARWADHDPSSGCDAHFDAHGRATVELGVSTPVALRALEGHVHVFPDSDSLVDLEPIGPAAGMTLVATREPGGIHFVMFAASGVPIPAAGATPPSILAVRVQAGPRSPTSVETDVFAERLVGADGTGNEIPECPRLTPVLDAARICRDEVGCDANFDGRISVRDLVGMLICLDRGCADSLRFDCDGDHSFTLQDVICCARKLLHAPPAGEPGRPADGTRMTFGDPQRTAAGWRVLLTIDPLGDLGAAHLALRFPVAGYTVTGVTRTAGGASWLPLFETDGDALTIGLVDLAAESPLPGSTRLELAIELAARDDAPGGEVTIENGEFSARDGAALAVALPAGPVRLPDGLELSAPRPNPSGAGTRFAVRVDRAADARITVHDLNGRRIATLFTGRLAPGARDFSWDGRDDRGRAVRDGIYFVRCAAGSRNVTQKLVRFGGR